MSRFTLVLVCLASPVTAGDGNRLSYLDEVNPYAPSRDFPKLVTPQWVGEEGVEAVVILAIDDMRDMAKYEEYLRPILLRLRGIDGRAPISIMTCSVDPRDPQLQRWLDEGLSIEVHTVDHPCPLLAGGDFAKAKSTYDRCVDLMAAIPRNEPVAFRMPCCDSMNTVSPRFYAEIFNRTTEEGRFLQASSSVFNLFTPADDEIPRDLVLDEEGRERFRRYLPHQREVAGGVFHGFVNWIEDYPYPYVIGGRCWEFPCAVPSDWEAQHLQGVNNPRTVEDLKRVLDITVAKRGVMNLVFHPHGWIRSDQVVDIVDHAVAKHGKKVKFLTFREAVERLNANLLAGQPLRNETGGDNGVRVLDVDDDGWMDVVIGNETLRRTRVWQPQRREWAEEPTPTRIENASFALLGPRGETGFVVLGPGKTAPRAWCHDGGWKETAAPACEFPGKSPEVRGSLWLFRDLDGDGSTEAIVVGGTNHRRAMFASWIEWPAEHGWLFDRFGLPSIARFGDEVRLAALRFVDVDEDGRLDVVYSDAERYGVWLFDRSKAGWWGDPVVVGTRREEPNGIVLPPIIRKDGTNNGFFVHSRHLVWQNEDTAKLPDLVARVSFDELLKDHLPGPRSPEQSLRLMEPRPGFRVELVAAEPLVVDPVAFEWGPDGRLWVAEMADYPLGNEGGGRVKVLEDTDGDGTYDEATLFLDGLNFPNGVMPWRDGVLVSAAPDVLFARDTDGDGRADETEKLLTGFGEGNQQHRVNGFVPGLDNLVHCANGDSNGRIVSTRTGAVTDVNGRDLRFDPDTGELFTTSGMTQFGRNRDDWGNWFGGNNANPMWHYALDDRYLGRNPHAVPPDPRVHVSVAPGAAPCFPVSRPLPRFNDFDKLNRFTSANSPMIYSDELFGPAFAGNAYVSEPVHNLVHREVVEPAGVTFTSRRADDEQRSEFLASRDNWFRPAMLKTGPDGALYVADVYRFVIEHPQYIPKELWDDWDFRAGDDRGRIYRVLPVGSKPRAVPRLDRLSPRELVAAIDSPNGWQRDTAQRLLVHRGERDVAPRLVETLTRAERPPARLHALCTLDGLDACDPDVLAVGLGDEHAGVRRHAIRIAEPWLARSEEVAKVVLALLDDDDPHVRLQLAYSLGEWDDPLCGRALGRLAIEAADPYTLAAVHSSLNERNVTEVLTAASSVPGVDSDPERLGNLMVLATRIGGPSALETVAEQLVPHDTRDVEPWRFRAIGRVIDALARRELDLADVSSDVAGRVDALSATARETVADSGVETESRVAAASLLGRRPESVDDDRRALAARLQPGEPVELQAVAIERLAASGGAGDVLERWAELSPGLRNVAVESLTRRRESLERLLAAIEAGEIRPGSLGPAQRQRILQLVPESGRPRAERALAAEADPDRRAVVDRYRPALETIGDAERGRALFVKSCATCHRVGELGHAVGPDLAALRDKSDAHLLEALFDPNRSVESRYVTYAAVTFDGRSYAGILESETSGGIVLLGPDARRVALPRSDIEILRSTATSAMPVGLEKKLTPKEVRDLVTYLRGLRGGGR